MEISFMRHGKAMPSSQHGDFERVLSPNGEEDIKKLASFLKNASQRFELVLCSPLKRTKQTAQLMVDGLGLDLSIIEDDRLACGASFGSVEELIDEYPDSRSFLVVGHAPDMGGICSELLGLSQGLSFPAGGFLKARAHFFRKSAGVLDSFLHPDLF